MGNFNEKNIKYIVHKKRCSAHSFKVCIKNNIYNSIKFLASFILHVALTVSFLWSLSKI